MNHSVFERCSGNTPKKCLADRFVPRRAGINRDFLKSKMFYDRNNNGDVDDIFFQHPQNWRLKGYRKLLSNTCGVDEITPVPLLKFSEKKRFNNNKSSFKPSWACCPRRRPVILQPDFIFDLPGYEEFMDYSVLDWGKRDFLVAGLVDQLFMLESSTNHVSKLCNLNNAMDSVYVVKWDPLGVKIAIGTELGILYIYDSERCFLIRLPSTWYQDPNEQYVAITALAWHPNGHTLASCTAMGTICVCDALVKKPPTIKRFAHESGIEICSYSPNEEFLVTSGIDGNVRIWQLPDLKPFFQIVYTHPAKSLAWHPWSSCQLAVGGGSGPQKGHGDGSLSVWNVSLQVNLCYQLPTIPCVVDSLAWSHLTGELVASYWIKGQDLPEHDDGHSRVLVLSAPGIATDEMLSPTGRTKVLLFNPDGTKIATASSDENLFIWNFLGTDGPLLQTHKRKIKKKVDMFKTHEINGHNNFGSTIR